MCWRKLYVRLLVFGIIGLWVAALVLYQHFTNAAAVRDQVLAKLKSQLPGCVVTVDSARLRIMGGIIVSNMHLARKDDPDQSEILHVPTAILYHNKEKILEGELSLSKMEFHRPHLCILRSKDGAWNLEGLAGPSNPRLPWPTVVIHQGTLVLEERGPKGTAALLELTDADLQMINDPLTTVTIEGSAHSTVVGRVRVSGQWQRQTRQLALKITAEQVSLAGIALERLEKLCPAGLLQGLKLEGQADLKAEIAYEPGASVPLNYEGSLVVSKAKVQHPQLPAPVEDLELSCRFANGDLRLDKLTAKSGLTEIEAHGSAWLPAPEQNFEAHVEARHLEMRESLFAPLPEKIRKLYSNFLPRGLAIFRAHVARRQGSWGYLAGGEPSTVQLQSETLGGTFHKFLFPVERLAGTVDMDLLTKLVRVDATGYSGERPIFIQGTWQGEGLDADCRFLIQATDLPLDEKVENAFVVPHLKKLVQSFHARGRGDIKAYIRHEPGAKEFANEYHVRFQDAAVRWDQFPLALEKSSGYLDIYPKYWEFREGRARHQGAEVEVEARSTNRPSKDGTSNQGVILKIVGRNLEVNEDLHQAMQPMKQLARSWDTFQPRGVLAFAATIDHCGADPDDVDVQLDLRGCTIEPVFFRWALDDIAGKFHYHANKLEIQNASARHGNTRIALGQGTVDLHSGGGQFTDLADLEVQGLVIGADLLRAMPKSLSEGCASLNVVGPLAFKTRLVVAQAESGSEPDIYWDGSCWVKDAKISTGLDWEKVSGTIGCVGRCNGRQLMGVNGNVLLEEASLLGQPFRKLQAKFQVRENAPDVLLLSVKGPIFGGDISGEARLEFNSSHRYELNLTGSQLDLGQFGKQNLGPASQMQGAVMARLYLTGLGSSIDTLDGNGSIDVPKGRLYNLPLLLDILRFLGLRSPDRTAFDELHSLFSVHGKRVTMRKLEILGSALCLTGKGEFNLDGTDVALDFAPGWPRLDALLPAPMRPLPPAVGKNLFTIEMRGKITSNEKDRKFTMKPIPGIIDPILRVRNQLSGAAPQDNHEEIRAVPGLMGNGN
jgi:hypothetical protein